VTTQIPYRGPVKSINVDNTLGREPDGRIMANGRRIGYWWSCRCHVRGSEPFAVVKGCDLHEVWFAHLPEKGPPKGYTDGDWVRGLE
jgi:hypothetical protein